MIGVDLFAGAGGMSLGARQAGISVEVAVESDAHAAKTYALNHPNTKVLCADIRRITNRRLRPWRAHCDDMVLFGGPPCQGFSWSNVRTRNTANDSNWLFEEFLRVARYLQPAWLVFENVQGLVNTAQGVFLQQITDGIKDLGYTFKSRLLNATHYGVPQDRTRYFLVGSRDGHAYRFPRKKRCPAPTVEDALRDLPKLENGDSTCWKRYGRAKPSSYAQRLRAELKGCCNHIVSRNATYVIQRYAHVPCGGNWESIPPRLMVNYEDRMRCHTGIYHRLCPRSPSVVIGNFRKNMLIHPDQDRGLSVREAARIQSFPDWYAFRGSIGFQQQQVGNAVPPLLAEAVFSAVVAADKKTRARR